MTDVTVGGAKPKREAVAEHTLIDAGGNPVDDMESAHGIGYKDLESDLAVTFVPTNPDAIRMLAVFGAKTLATNTASQNKREAPKDRIEAIEDVFAYMNDAAVGSPQWRDSQREGGPRWDVATMASAAVDVLIEDKKLKPENKDAAYAKFFEQMSQAGESGKAAVNRVKDTAGVLDQYRKLRGKSAGTTDDLLSMVA